MNSSADLEPGLYTIWDLYNRYIYLDGNSPAVGNYATIGNHSIEKWQVLYMGNGVYRLRSNSDPPQFIRVWGLEIGKTAQDFLIIPDGEDSYRIVTCSSTLWAFTEKDWSVIQAEYTNSDLQRWIFVPT